MKLRTLITTATTAALLSTAGIAIAGATSSSSGSSPSVTASATAPATANAAKPAHAHRRARLRHRIRVFVRKVVLETIGIDRPTLRNELRGGKTIGEIATAHGVEPSAVIDALVTGATTKLDAAAGAGKITTERAQKIEAKLPARFTKLVNSWHPRRVRNAAEAHQ
ncbi:MAG TPA: hypothetical protein VL769_00100 [Acidimicrobiia bacterium]|nr:hypothetical protein [Acidimicrobiia bacterium]